MLSQNPLAVRIGLLDEPEMPPSCKPADTTGGLMPFIGDAGVRASPPL